MSTISKDAPRHTLSSSSAQSPAALDQLRKLLEKSGVPKKTTEPTPVSTKTATASKAKVAFNDTFKKSGSFTVEGRALTIEVRWQQANFKPGVKYPAKSKAITYQIYVGGKLQKGWPSNGPAYLDANGRAHIPVRQPKGRAITLKSTESFHSDRFKSLVKAVNQIKAENSYIKKHGLKSLPSAVKNKKGYILTTQGALMLGALVQALGSKAVSNRQSALAIRLFDNIQRLLKSSGMGKTIHKMMHLTGLNVEHHPVRGRSLIPGGSTSARVDTPQYTSLSDIAKHGSLVGQWQEELGRLIITDGNRNNPTQEQIIFAETLIRSALDGQDGQTQYAARIMSFLRNQKLVFPNGIGFYDKGVIMSVVSNLLSVAADVRAGRTNYRAYFAAVAEAQRQLQPYYARGILGITPRDFTDMLGQFPGFQMVRQGFFNAAETQLRRTIEFQIPLDQIANKHSLPVEIVLAILACLARFYGVGIRDNKEL